MKTFNLISLLSLLLILPACQSIHNSKLAENFDRSSKAYNRMVRWHEIDKTPLYFVDESIREEFQKRVDAARDVQIADYRVREVECLPDKGTAKVTVDWDYYILPSVTIKTVEDRQKWRYLEEEGKEKGWQLMTLLPEFK